VQRLLRHAKGNGLKSIQSRINNLNATINYEVTKTDKAEINIKIPIDEISN
jgi:signal transduction histidine kinase